MSAMRVTTDDARIEWAIAELKSLILARYPHAGFKIGEGDDPPGTYLIATVDEATAWDIIDLITDRLVTIQEDEGLPVYVIPAHSPAQVEKEMQAHFAKFGQS